MELSTAPLLFIHYGNSSYLRYTLAAAKKSNPEKRIILLGDEDNAVYRKLGIEHVLFNAYSNSVECKKFLEVYRPVAGKLHMQKTFAERWLRFVFFRWFILHTFLKQQGIDAFWTFDSDTLLLEPLQESEAFFKSFDCTSQCTGSCMNGYVSNTTVVTLYVQKILDLFQRQDFLAAQQEEFDTVHPSYAFTEMRAFEVLCKEENISVWPLVSPVEGAVFDDCLALGQGYVQQSKAFYNGKHIKQLWLFDDQKVYAKRESDGELVRFKSLNMSWLPDYYIAYVYDVLFEKRPVLKHGEKVELFKQEPVFSRYSRGVRAQSNRLKQFLKNILYVSTTK